MGSYCPCGQKHAATQPQNAATIASSDRGTPRPSHRAVKVNKSMFRFMHTIGKGGFGKVLLSPSHPKV